MSDLPDLPRAEDIQIEGWEVLTVGELDAPVEGWRAGVIVLQQQTTPEAEPETAEVVPTPPPAPPKPKTKPKAKPKKPKPLPPPATADSTGDFSITDAEVNA